jgi:SAM-dependent methyltransferase
MRRKDETMASLWRQTGVSGTDYDARFTQMERAGHDMHGEANFVAAFDIRSVLDAGCGTGRIAIELARRGFDVVGIDRDPGMLHSARAKAPALQWYLEDLATCLIPAANGGRERRCFDAIVMAGNVMIFVDAGTEQAVLGNMARHLNTGGLLIAGFQLDTGGLSLARYDRFASQVGLELTERWSTWDRQPWEASSPYAVSVHRRSNHT